MRKLTREETEIERENKLIIDMMYAAAVGIEQNKSDEQIKQEQDKLFQEWEKSVLLTK